MIPPKIVKTNCPIQNNLFSKNFTLIIPNFTPFVNLITQNRCFYLNFSAIFDDISEYTCACGLSGADSTIGVPESELTRIS